MKQPIIYSTRPFRDEFIEQIQTFAPNYQFKTELTPAELSQVEISLGWNREFQSELLASNNLKWVQSISAGVDTLPLEEFSKHDILLSNGSGIHSESIAEHLMGVIFGYSRGLFQAQKAQVSQNWLGSSVHYQAIQNKKLLIIGTGRIGKMVAQRAEVFGMEIYGINTTGRPVEHVKETFPLAKLKEVLPTMDIVINILPLTEQTHGLFNQELFTFFSPTALFINVGRGPSVKTNELIDALNQKKLAFAALDVFEEEPLPENSPLWSMENVLITPHIAGLTPHFQTKFMDIFLKNLESYLSTQTLVVNQVQLLSGY